MRDFKYIWLAGIAVTALIVIVPVILVVFAASEPVIVAVANVPDARIHTDHSALLTGPYETGSDVTRACLTCHEDAASEVMQTSHYTWLSEPQTAPDRQEPIEIGKANLINNFCIGIQSNWQGCTRCHAGYGWQDADYFEVATQENVDCLVCHDQTGSYAKANAGAVAEGVDLVAVAQSVGAPTRQNCGYCHFNGGGGNGVKHGDLDESLYFPPDDLDVHMGRYDFQCIDCHQTENHEILGRAVSVNIDTTENQVSCVNCHDNALHADERINAHLDTVACQTCHVPEMARRDPTKTFWDWSTAGQDWEENPHEYLRIKGSFIYESNVVPDYVWFNGYISRYLLGDTINPDEATPINRLQGDVSDLNALIYPVKIHDGFQVYDAEYNYFLQPQTTGEDGYWTTFDWNQALQNGSEATGLPYSGDYGFAPTTMYWTLSHMVAPAEDALRCASCHGVDGRFDWQALGYAGDPMQWGGRSD